jgi:hypothetical protein
VDYYVDGTLAALSVPITAGTDFTTAVIGSGLSSAGGDAYYDDLCIDKGALSFNTITVQPPPPPTVVAPIIPGANSVTVENIDTNATQVALYRDGIIFNAFDPAGADTFNFFLIPNAVSGEVFTATQTVGGLTSPQSAGVTVLLPGPTLYKAPAAGETSVRVLDINTNASLVEVKVDGIVRGSANPNGATDVDVALGAFVLSQGEEVTAKIVVNSIDSVDSAPETVTTNVTTDIVCDDFESYADQAAFQASAWTPTTGDVFQTLSTVENATPSGFQSLFAPVAATTRVEQTFANTIPTAEVPGRVDGGDLRSRRAAARGINGWMPMATWSPISSCWRWVWHRAVRRRPPSTTCGSTATGVPTGWISMSSTPPPDRLDGISSPSCIKAILSMPTSMDFWRRKHPL